MTWWRVFLFSCVVVACTKANPAKHCDTGTCIDPAFPFCDATGVVSGEPGTCIAASCTPGQFLECRSDNEVRCNATGNNYDVVQCSLGCDAAADGCRLCNPGETACTNGKVATCDANGVVVSSSACVLGCFENEPRCRQVQPSNGLGTYLDMVPSPPDLDLSDARFSTMTGDLTDLSGAINVPTFLIAAPPQGSPTRVIIAHDVHIQKLVVDTSPVNNSQGPAFAIVATGNIVITGLLQIDPMAGGFDTPGCTGGNGLYSHDCLDAVSGAGGGANATNGAKGGDFAPASNPGGAAGIAAGTPTLVPLRGGCSGGLTNGPGGIDGIYGAGGGAVQLTSEQSIRVDGIIDVKGQGGGAGRYAQETGYYIVGGGGGGSVLLEAPVVALDINAQLQASGGGGASLCSQSTTYCGVSGAGAHAGVAAVAGGTAAACDGVHFASAGGGGGGLGRIRINTRDGAYSKANTSLEDGNVTTGVHATR